jgi:hypothetical protein
VEFTFSGPVWHWRGPAPHHFVDVPAEEAAALAEICAAVTYGWGMIPVEVELGKSTWTTSLWPRDGGYVVPLKAAVRARERVELDDVVTLTLRVRVP